MASSSSATTTGSAPCGTESVLWRECLKTYDYGPERPEKECERERGRYYECIRAWREGGSKSGGSAAAVTSLTGSSTATAAGSSSSSSSAVAAAQGFQLHKSCTAASTQLHNCMMINMFEVGKCTKEMTALRVCAAKFDPVIASALEDDVKAGRVELPSVVVTPEDTTGLKRLWFKIIGKV